MSLMVCIFCGRDVYGSTYCAHCKRDVPPENAGTHFVVGRVDHGDDDVRTSCGLTLSTWGSPIAAGVFTYDRARVTCAKCRIASPETPE